MVANEPILLEMTFSNSLANVTPAGTPVAQNTNGDNIYATANNQSLFMLLGTGQAAAPFNIPAGTRAVFYLMNTPQTVQNVLFQFQQPLGVPLNMALSGVTLSSQNQGAPLQQQITNPNNPQDLLLVINVSTQAPAPVINNPNPPAQNLAANPLAVPNVIPQQNSGNSRGGGSGGIGVSRTLDVNGLVGAEISPTLPSQNCFPDIADLSESQKTAICELKGTVIRGKPQPDGSFLFDPHALLNRAEAAKIISYALVDLESGEIASRESEILEYFKNQHASNPILENKPTMYSDVAEDKWFAPPVVWLSENDVVKGYGDSGLFGPQNPLLRVELEKVSLLYFSKIVLRNKPKNFIREYLEKFNERGIAYEWWAPFYAFSQSSLNSTELVSLPPDKTITRAVFTEYFYHLLKLVAEKVD